MKSVKIQNGKIRAPFDDDKRFNRVKIAVAQLPFACRQVYITLGWQFTRCPELGEPRYSADHKIEMTLEDMNNLLKAMTELRDEVALKDIQQVMKKPTKQKGKK